MVRFHKRAFPSPPRGAGQPSAPSPAAAGASRGRRDVLGHRTVNLEGFRGPPQLKYALTLTLPVLGPIVRVTVTGLAVGKLEAPAPSNHKS